MRLRSPSQSPATSALACLALLGALAAPIPASAKDLGVRGATWAIAEPDLLEAIEARLLEMERSGALARFEREAKARVRSSLETPEPVPGIAPATEHRSRLFDPSIVLDRDIRLPDGTLLARAGARVNPLARMPLTRDLLFIDGRRDVEVDWALAQGKAVTIVLLAGRPLALARRHGRPFFFDQGGRLSRRFGLRATPARIEPAGPRLRITEIPLRDDTSGVATPVQRP